MSEVNPHTGRPYDDETNSGNAGADAAPGAGAAFEADAAPKLAAPESRDALTPSAERSDAVPPAPDAAPGTPSEAAPTQQELAIRSALETVMDPEIGLSVIDLGLIREVHVLEGRTLVKMMLTTPFCPYAPQLMADVKSASLSVVPQPCEVEILPDAWSPDLMPDPGLLGYSF